MYNVNMYTVEVGRFPLSQVSCDEDASCRLFLPRLLARGYSLTSIYVTEFP